MHQDDQKERKQDVIHDVCVERRSQEQMKILNMFLFTELGDPAHERVFALYFSDVVCARVDSHG